MQGGQTKTVLNRKSRSNNVKNKEVSTEGSDLEDLS